MKKTVSITEAITKDGHAEEKKKMNCTSFQREEIEDKDVQHLTNGQDVYLQAALSGSPITDKVTDHSYQLMYGNFLLPYYYRNPTMKMLEIGLGCDMRYGPGASVALHQKLFPQAEIWEAEYDFQCVNKHRDGVLKDINIVTGDQGNTTDLDRWIKESGGNFDVIIDDGGHQNCQIWLSLKKLWPTLKSGGLYFIEDMQVGQNANYKKFHDKEACDGNTLVMSNEINDIVNDMIYKKGNTKEYLTKVDFVFCQSEACVLGKS